MEIWRVGYGEERPPAVISRRTLLLALVIHLAFFAVFWLFAVCHGFFDKKEEIIPIDLTVVVNENLDGKPDEPPPLRKPEPEKPKPRPKPKPKAQEPEKPKALEQIVTNVVAQADKREEKKPEKPRKTKEQLRKEQLERIRSQMKTVSTPIEVRTMPSGNGRTDRKTLSESEIRRRLMEGYRPGRSEQLAASDEQLGFSLIKMAVEGKWETPPWTDTMKPMAVRIWFGNGGKVVGYKLEKSSGDARADNSIVSAASRVGAIPGMPAAFIDKYRKDGVPVRFTVRPQSP